MSNLPEAKRLKSTLILQIGMPLFVVVKSFRTPSQFSILCQKIACYHRLGNFIRK